MKIAVCIPCCLKHVNKLERVLTSIEKQTIKPDIVSISISGIQGCSYDVNKFSFPLKITCTPEHKNASENRNIALGAIIASYDLVSFFDADDYMHPKRLETIKNIFEKTNCDVVLHNGICIENENIKNPHLLFGDDIGIDITASDNFLCGHCTCTSILLKNIQFDESDECRGKEDSIFIQTCMEKGYTLEKCTDNLSLYIKFEPKIHCWWTGDNEMSSIRNMCLSTIANTELEVVFVTKQSLPFYILVDQPLHKGYEYLSDTHKGDYLKAYFMHFYGSGYTDIKPHTKSWINSYEQLKNSTAFCIGYQEGGSANLYNDPVTTELLKQNTHKLIGNGAYIFKCQTQLSKEWYNKMMNVMDTIYEDLKKYPARHPSDVYSTDYPYPLRHTQVCGDIFHPLIYKYREHVLKTLPMFERCEYK